MPRGSAPLPLPVASSWPLGEALGSAMSAIPEVRLVTMRVNIKRVLGNVLTSTRLGMDVDMFGLGLLRWVRESVLSSKAPHRERVKFVLDGDEDGKGKEKRRETLALISL